ncbi:MAG: hypothetical protein KDA42_06260 [Planctomycetales bacterium]|nr:hypothetical protein [Planctomycetales bacterium]
MRSLWIRGAVLAVISGCGPSGPVTYSISGNVTFDGTPVEQGEIIFRAADGASGSWASRIVEGKYRLESTVGKKRVEITARRQVAGRIADSGEPAIATEMYVPDCYNRRSELAVEILEDGERKFDFPLVSAKK